VMVAGVAAAALVAAIQLLLIARALAPAVAPAVPEYRTGEWTHAASSLLAVSFLVILLGQLDVLVAGFFLDPAQIGIYSAAIRVTTLIGFVPLSVTIVASPQIAALHAQHDTRGLQDLASRIAHLSFWPSLAAAAGLLLLATPILRLFGPEFVSARWVLWILALTQLFKSGMGAVGYFLDMTGHQAYNARAFAAASVVGVALNLIAIPRFGILGAASASFASWVFVMFWLHREVAHRVGVHASIVSALRLQRQPGTAR
jgi:O-antigen/teichoic acid export membrane protein